MRESDGKMMEEIKVEVAGVCILMRLNSIDLGNRIRSDYGIFLSSGEPSLTLDINLTDKEYVNESSWAGLIFSDNEIEISDNYLMSRIDMDQGKGTAEITSTNLNIGLGTLLRNIFTLKLLLQDNSVILHAAAILKANKAYIFLGPSGSGKTTVSNLSEGCTVLSDDMVIVKPVNGSFGVFPNPCWLDMQKGDRENRSYQIGGIFKLVQDNTTYFKKIPQAKAMAEIFTVPHIPVQFQPVQKLLNIFSSIIEEVSLYELHFKKDKSFWRYIDELKR